MDLKAVVTVSNAVYTVKFPSPCGVMDLKVVGDTRTVSDFFVSVPLRGFVSVCFLSPVFYFFLKTDVSVPLRGNGSERCSKL